MMKGISGVPIAPFNGAPHALELSTWLTATLPAADKRNEINIAISADQIAANHLGAFTALPSLELATMPQTWKEPGRFERGLLFALQLSFPNAGDACGGESTERALPPVQQTGGGWRWA